MQMQPITANEAMARIARSTGPEVLAYAIWMCTESRHMGMMLVAVIVVAAVVVSVGMRRRIEAAAELAIPSAWRCGRTRRRLSGVPCRAPMRESSPGQVLRNGLSRASLRPEVFPDEVRHLTQLARDTEAHELISAHPSTIRPRALPRACSGRSRDRPLAGRDRSAAFHRP
jgi:hypothetical protein